MNSKAIARQLHEDGCAIVGGGTNDLGVVTGAFGSGAAGTNVYRLFNYSGSLTDNGLTIGAFPVYARGFIDLTTPGQVNLLVIPEPSALLLLSMSGLLLLRRTVNG